MRLRIRTETAMEELEKARRLAAEKGPEVAEKLEEDLVVASAKDSKTLKEEVDGTGSSESSSSTSDDSGTSDDGGGSDGGGEGDPFENPSDDEDPSDPDDDAEEDPEEPDDGEDDPDDEPEEPEEDEEEPADPEPSDEEKEKTESFRDLDFIPNDVPVQLRVEGAGEFLSSLGNSAGFVLGALGSVGLKVASFALTGMFRVVIYTFARCFKILSELFSYVALRIERFSNRTSELKNRVQALQKQIEELKAPASAVKQPTGVLDVDMAYLASSHDTKTALHNHAEFMRVTNAKFQRSILSELEALEMVSNAHYLKKSFDGLKFMEVHPDRLGLVRGAGEAPPLTSLYEFPDIIGGVSLQMYLPDAVFDSWAVVEKAYGNARVQLAVNADASLRPTDEMPVPTLDELSDLLNILELLIAAAEDHLRLCDKIASKRGSVLNTIKALFMQLAQSVTRVYLNDSGAIPLYLKSSFVTKVYLVGAMDLHDHSARVIANGIAYASAALKRYR